MRVCSNVWILIRERKPFIIIQINIALSACQHNKLVDMKNDSLRKCFAKFKEFSSISKLDGTNIIGNCSCIYERKIRFVEFALKIDCKAKLYVVQLEVHCVNRIIALVVCMNFCDIWLSIFFSSAFFKWWLIFIQLKEIGKKTKIDCAQASDKQTENGFFHLNVYPLTQLDTYFEKLKMRRKKRYISSHAELRHPTLLAHLFFPRFLLFWIRKKKQVVKINESFASYTHISHILLDFLLLLKLW